MEDATIAILGPPLFMPIDVPGEKADITKSNIYAYSYYRPSKLVEFTIGLSADLLERGEQIDTDQFNPKLGLLWQPGDGTTVRLAAFRVLSSTNVATQTIEPTHVGGFNQFFEDENGSEVWNYGAAVSHDFSDRVIGGVELTKRDLNVPEYGRTSESAEYSAWQEYLGAAYLYWTPHDFFALSAAYQYERFDRKDNLLGQGIAEVTTHRFPLVVKFFHPGGFSCGFKATYYLQEGEFQPANSSAFYTGSDNFWVVDAEISYRFPKRFGILSIGVKNLLDETFSYQDTDSSNSTVSETISIYSKLTLSF